MFLIGLKDNVIMMIIEILFAFQCSVVLFQTSAVLCTLYVFFWVIPRRLNFICRHFGTLCPTFIGK